MSESQPPDKTQPEVADVKITPEKQPQEDPIHENNVPNPTLPIDILAPVQHLSFTKPDIEILSASILYEMNDEAGKRIFCVFRTSPSKFQPRCDIEIVDNHGNCALLLINSKKHPKKIVVRSGGVTLGSVSQTNCVGFSPKFSIRGSDKKEIAVVYTKKGPCCLTSCCCFGVTYGIFCIVRRQDSNGKMLVNESLIGTISRGLPDDDGKNALRGLLEVEFIDLQLDVKTKSLFIAAAIFIDFAVFALSHANDGQGCYKSMFISGMVLVILLFLGIFSYCLL